MVVFSKASKFSLNASECVMWFLYLCDDNNVKFLKSGKM